MGRAIGHGLWSRPRLALIEGQCFGREISDGHIIGDMTNITATRHFDYRVTRSEVTHGYIAAEVFYTNARIGGTTPPGGCNVANCLIFKLGG